MKKTLLFSAAALLLCAPNAFSQNDFGSILHYTEIEGVREFSGELTVRPFQIDALLEQGYTYQGAVSAHEYAGTMVQDWLIEYVEATDEFILDIPEGQDENSLSNQLVNTGLFQYAEPNWYCYPVRTPNDPRYNSQWHHNKMNSATAWDHTTGDSNFIAGWVDTGVDLNHEDLQAHLLSGYNSADRKTQANGGNVSDVNGHGTMTGGCIGAIGNNSKGVAGMCWSVKLLPVRCSNSSGGGAYLDDITNGLRWCVDNGAKTASASYGGVDSNSAGTTGTYIMNNGGLCMWASGNEYRKINGYDHSGVIVVGATNQSDTKTSWSNYGALIDCVAPGEGIWTTKNSSNNAGYDSVSGTSFSTPIVNGVCAMIWAADPTLTNHEVQDILYTTCKDIDASGEDNNTGHGRADMGDAVTAAAGGSTQFALNVPAVLSSNQSTTLTVDGATPNGRVYYYYSLRGTGVTWVGHLGVFIELRQARESGSATANANGTATYTRVIPASGAGRTVWIQAAESGAVTNVEQRDIL